MSRRLIALVAAVAVVVLAVGGALLLRGGGDNNKGQQGGQATTRTGTGRAEALAYAPKNTPVLVGVDSGAPAAGLLLGQFLPRLTNGALSAADVQPLLGGEAVLAILDTRTQRGQVSLVAPTAADVQPLVARLKPAGEYRGAQLYTGPRGSAIATRGAEIVAASDQATVKRALNTRQNIAGHFTPTEFDRRLGGLDPHAPVRTIFDPLLLVRRRLPQVLNTRWGRALTNGSAVLTSGPEGLRVPFKLQTDPNRLTNADLPFATGPQPPQLKGRAPLLIGVRNFAPTIRFLRKADPDRFGALDTFEQKIPSFLRVNPDDLFNNLSNDATLSSADLLKHYVARTDPRDPDVWRQPLQRLSTLSNILQNLGIDNIKLDEEPGDAYRLIVDGKMVIRAGIFGPTLVLTDHPRIPLQPAANAPAAPTPAGAAGALTFRFDRAQVKRLLTDQFGLPPEASVILARLGDLTGWARSERDGLRGELRLGVR